MKDPQAQTRLAYARRHRFGTTNDLPIYITACALFGMGLFAVTSFRADALLTNRNALLDPVSYAYATFAWFGAAGIAGIVTLVLWVAGVRSRGPRSGRGVFVAGIASSIMVVAGLVAGYYVGLALRG